MIRVMTPERMTPDPDKVSEPDHVRLMLGAPPDPDAQVTLANWREPGFGRWSFSHIRQLLPTAPIAAADQPYVLPESRPENLPENRIDLAALAFGPSQRSLDDFLTASNTDALMVMRDGKLVFDWFGGFGRADRPHIAFSVSKSLAGLLVGILVEAGVLDPDQQLTHYLPEIAASAYDGASLRHLLDMTVASGFVEDYMDTTGVFMAYRRASAWNPVEEGHSTEGLRAFLAKLPASDGNHGHRHHYCSTHTDLLGWVIERAAGGPVADLLSSHLFRPAGTRTDAYITLETFGAPRLAGGICLAPADLLRLAEMVRCEGALGGRQIVPAGWIADFSRHPDSTAWQRQTGGSRLFDRGTYRSKWYRTGFDDDEICAIGIHGQWIWINPARAVTIIRMASHDLPIDTETDTELLAAFQAIATAL